ncbi:uncharacterized protein MONBRDRAFT_29823 [Monosiga brevicollis MX1]|uniref:Amidophosphoribosyltransferase n=1 Tax=Monosiga brevicollis TaxID=81824 RepID=A9VC81_MONBE|nr:uncharacterized protein MONBRDRAFT_29823 [Monosiga brevicollis MX1]EDQ84815.1 predicted protein [Monosiga brevicollis MX1]|eukprot:XP_001750316.1 hypothetical protein [Monosiga brevicollis MX1]
MVLELEHLHEACGVFGIYVEPKTSDNQPDIDVAQITSLGLSGLQHRGQESAGMVTSGTDGKLRSHKGFGLVDQVFSPATLSGLTGNMAIGHNRYATAGGSTLSCSQPFILKTLTGNYIAVAHNGQLTNHDALSQRIMQHGVGLSSDSDSEIIAQILCSPPAGPHSEHVHGIDFASRLKSFMQMAATAYSLVALCDTSVYAVRDPFGNRPLSVGRLRGVERNAWVVASETCCFSAIGAEVVREVLPGEIVRLDCDGLTSVLTVPRVNRMPDQTALRHTSRSSRPPSRQATLSAASSTQDLSEIPAAFCIFEYVYFSQPESILEGQMVHSVRQRCGARLAREAPIEADVVSTVPTSATAAAIGFAHAMGIGYNEVLSKNNYVGRTFIKPDDRMRKLGVLKKFAPITENIKGKRIVIVDDSIVRGTTMGPIIDLLRQAGALEVHIRIASPPLKYPCYMGINIPTREELIANRMAVEDMAAHFGADSLAYLSLDGLKSAVLEKAVSADPQGPAHCTACLSGDYPVELDW